MSALREGVSWNARTRAACRMQLRPLKVLVRAALTLIAPLATARAQYTEARVGERIRFEAPGVVAERYTGTVLQRTADSLLVGSGDAPALSLALASITRMDVSRGRSAGAGARRGLLIGAGVGAVAGVVSAADLRSDEPEGSLVALLAPVIVVVEAAIFGAVGAAIGAVVKREVWDSYTPTERRVGVAVHEGTVRVGVQIVR